ncbi:unnamed protein product, partial [Mesorhabditis belari]|uniref:EGF domain-specific O-linked N-acetylglucosamine transferase n=1 Tax=Mesorhabditis belari TaxID=2138241 RepID=A0AAF3EYV2_9BILA
MRVISEILLIFLCSSQLLAIREEYKDLFPEFAEYFITGNKRLHTVCRKDPECPVKNDELKSGKCLGFEVDCARKLSYSANRTAFTPPKPGENWNGDEKWQRDNFYQRGDFGYVKERSILHEICTAENEEQTVLHCSDNLRHCWAKNIFFDFKNLKVQTSTRYREDVIQKGQSGGNCGRFYHDIIRNNMEHLGYLQSWAHELQHFTSDPEFRVDPAHCDIIFERPTVIIKLDASVNMFHHFCDFVNLFASQMINGSFTREIDVLWWDTDRYGFIDNLFGATWKAFSNRKPVELISLDQKKVCFKNALLPLLARQRFGLFYNTPVVRGCSGSGLFHAFSHHILNRLEIPQNGPMLWKNSYHVSGKKYKSSACPQSR